MDSNPNTSNDKLLDIPSDASNLQVSGEKNDGRADSVSADADEHCSIPQLPEKNEGETVTSLRNQLEMLTNSLAVLSAEKSKMEAMFQSEKRQIRNEREEYEKLIKSLKEKSKRLQGSATTELEHLKYKFIMERHEKEKELAEYSSKIKELQKMVNHEKKLKEQLEQQLKEVKNAGPGKSHIKVLEAEVDVLRNKLKQTETASNETPAMLINLQSEISAMRKKHKHALLEEQKRAAIAEQEARALAASHESRVAGLEARLAELSEVVGGYDRLRQQDKRAIQKLKHQLETLHSNQKQSCSTNSHQLTEEIKSLYQQLVDQDKNSSHIAELLGSLNLCNQKDDISYKEKYQALLQEFEDFKENSSRIGFNNETATSNDETQLQRTRSHNKNLEEKLRMVLAELSEKEKDFQTRMDQQQKLLHEQCSKTGALLTQKDNEYSNKIAFLEQQLLKQRERSISIIQEKDQEIQRLKSSVDAFFSEKNTGLDSNISETSSSTRKLSTMSGNSDLMPGIISENNTPILHYTQELARKEVQISGLRKQNIRLEASIRELEMSFFRESERHEEVVKKLETYVKRLEASKSRENANLEYLKNVFINYLTSNDTERKRHMLNAISTVLQFTSDETEKITRHK
ncbi:hypothetical protein QAD02_004876 [Eretmocerus hayati]|uniref:Uncharacterized protein n=1 Tax=Eretmocerus hayati TaxID=131215 RepID=A0ACC2NQT6_9HYME|nr:hypothetical protein QAD02_004876 [Eretmocerus hayati]